MIRLDNPVGDPDLFDADIAALTGIDQEVGATFLGIPLCDSMSVQQLSIQVVRKYRLAVSSEHSFAVHCPVSFCVDAYHRLLSAYRHLVAGRALRPLVHSVASPS